MKLNDMFENIYCINLDTRADRWEECQAEFKKHNILNVERFSAATGDEVLENLGYVFPIKPGEAGLVQTHINILLDALKNNYKSILILEDDVEFSNDINNSLEYIPEMWDVIYFGGNHAWGWPNQINDKVAIANKTLAMHCVGIKNTVYEKMLSKITFQQPIDVTYAYNLYLMNSFVMLPSQAWQRPGFSDLVGHYVDYGFLK